MLDWVRRRLWGISRRLIASYVLVTVAAVVLVELLVLGFQVPRLVSEARFQDQVSETAQKYWAELSQRYPHGVPPGTLLGDRDQPLEAGVSRTNADGTLIVPAIRGPVRTHKAVTAAVAMARDGTIIASSLPSRYPPGQAARGLPVAAMAAIRAGRAKGVSPGSAPTPYGPVAWILYGRATPATLSAGAGAFTYLYIQTPQRTGFMNPFRAWARLRSLSGISPFTFSYVGLIAILPIGVLFGLLASRQLVGRVRRLERASVAVADGDYSFTVPTSGRDEVGRLEANFTAMTHQLSSALAAERERATSEARAAERSRIAREIHDAISQHLFGLRMIASGMRRADPHNEQVRSIERITEEALHDMQVLLWELRPPDLDGSGLTPALQELCTAYRERLGVSVDADLADITLPEPAEQALLRVAQEACTNAVRHGRANRLAVSMTRRDGQVELAIADNGTGFDPLAAHAGSGLRHIRERLDELGGTVNIASAPGEGTAVTVRVPAP